jgi:hypothetical protein
MHPEREHWFTSPAAARRRRVRAGARAAARWLACESWRWSLALLVWGGGLVVVALVVFGIVPMHDTYYWPYPRTL